MSMSMFMSVLLWIVGAYLFLGAVSVVVIAFKDSLNTVCLDVLPCCYFLISLFFVGSIYQVYGTKIFQLHINTGRGRGGNKRL